MAAMRKIMSGLLHLKSPPSNLRCISTQTAAAEKKDNPLVGKVKANQSSSITDILDEYRNQGNAVTRDDLIGLSLYLRRNYNPYHTDLQLHDWMEKNKIGATSSDHARHIFLLFKNKGLAAAENFFNNLEDSHKDEKTYGALLSCFSKEKFFDKGLAIVEKRKDFDRMTSFNYNHILILYISAGQPEKVPSLVEEMEERGIVPDMYTYNLLISSYSALKNLDAAEGVLQRMKDKGMECSSITYGYLATMYFNSGLHVKAKTYLEMMEKMENQPHTDVFESFKLRVQLYSKMNDLSGVIRAWESLKSARSKCNNSSYLSMLVALSKLGDGEKLEEVYKEWEKVCGYFDFRLQNVVMEFYLRQNRIKEATDLYEKVIKRGKEPNLSSLNLFATLCVKTSRIDLALEYLEIGIEKAGARKRDWFPPDETIQLFRTYFEENKDADRVKRFITSMKKISRVESTVYDSLLSKTNDYEAEN